MKEIDEDNFKWSALIKGFEISCVHPTVCVNLFYPPYETDEIPIDKTKYVEVGIDHVRAADNVRLHYDFERDGWSIEQASIFEWEIDDIVCDPDWQEVAFVKAWGRQKDDNELD